MPEKIIYTTCPEEHDYNQSTTVDSKAGMIGKRIVRKVLISQNEYLISCQISRYRSSITDIVATEKEWKELLKFNLATECQK